LGVITQNLRPKKWEWVITFSAALYIIKEKENNIGINIRPSIAAGIENIANKAIESVIGPIRQCGSLLDK